MTATWSHPCTPAVRDWVAFVREHASSRNTESESGNLQKKQDVDLKHDGLDEYHLDASLRRLQGADG